MNFFEKKNLINIIFSLVVIALFSFAFFGLVTTAQVSSYIDVSAYLVGNNNQELVNGEYEVRFAIYRVDRLSIDAYPSNTDASQRVWEESQKIKITDGVLRAYLGSVNPLPDSVTFNDNEYYLGVRIGQDSEMAPRKRIGAVPSAVNSSFLRGATIGTGAGNILQLNQSGKVDVSNLPTGTGNNQLVLGNDSRLDDVTLDSLGIAKVENVAISDWEGSTNLSTLGTISSGTWHGADIDISEYTNLAVSGSLLELFGDTLSLKEGTMTNDSLCTFSTTLGLVCDTAPGVGGVSYEAGNGLQLVGSTFSVDSNVMLEGDGVSLLTNDSGFITDGNTNWDNSYGFITDGNSGWDNSYGFITSADDSVSGSELDGVFSTTGLLRRTGANTYDTITDNSSNWNTAFGWGDHSLVGYLTAYVEIDPIFGAWDKSTGISITESQISDLQNYLLAETDPIFGASSAAGIVGTDITNWNTAFGWGDHAGAGYITDGNTGWDNSYGFITSADDSVSGSELDGVFSTTGLLKRTGAAIYTTITDNSANWDTAFGWGDHSLEGYLTAYVETDPIFIAWDKSTGISITESQISDLQAYLLAETDPIFGASSAAGIAGTDITNWNNAFGWGDHAGAGYITDGNSGWDNSYGFITASSSDTLTNKTWNGNLIGLTYGGTNKNLTTSNGGIVWTDADSMEVLAANANAGLALVSGGAGTPSWFAPTAGSVLFAGTNGALSQDNTNFFWNDTNNYLKLGDGTSNYFSLGLDATDSDKFKIYSGDGIAGTDVFSIDTNGVTSIANLELGSSVFADDAGAVSWIDMSVVSATAGTIERYTAFLDGNPMLSIYGTSDGIGGVANRGVGIGTVTPGYELDVVGDINSSGEIIAATRNIVDSPAMNSSLFVGESAGTQIFAVYAIGGDGRLILEDVTGTEKVQLSSDGDSYLTGGNVGIGDASPLSPFTVGDGDLFQINTSGEVVAGSWLGTAIGAAKGGTGIDTSASTGVPYISAGTWSVDANYLSLAHGGTNKNLTASNGGIVWTDADSMEVLAANANSGLALVSGGAGTPSWFAPTAGSILFAGTNGALSQDNTNFFWNDTNNYLKLGDGTSNYFSLGLDATDSDKFKIYPGDGIAGTDVFSIDTNGVTSIANLELGSPVFADDAGIISWIDMGVVSATDNTVESYTAQLDGNAMLTIYGLSDGSGGVDNLGVGIGTTTPVASLHVVNNEGAVDTAQGLLVHLDDPNFGGDSITDANNGGGFVITADGAAGAGFDFFAAISDADGTDDAEFRVRGDGEVYGDGASYTSGADYAEFFYTDDVSLASGEAVCMDVIKPNAIRRCERSGDDNVIGIISTNPAFVGNNIPGADGNLGEMDEHYKIVGLIGQVPAKVALDGGLIRVGDSVTPSETPGYLRRAEAGESTVGIALESLKSESGEIKVLISRRNKSMTVEAVEETVAERIAGMEIQDEIKLTLAKELTTYSDQFAQLANRILLNSGRLDTVEGLQSILKTQMDLIQNQTEAIIDFQLAFKPEDAIFKDVSGNVDLLGGELEADGIVAGAFTVKVVDPDRKTIGEAVIEAVNLDEDGDKIDDETESDGRSVEVKTKAVTKTAKIFVSFENNPGGYYWVEKIADQEDEEKFIGFKIMVSAAVEKDVKASWTIIEEKR